jgi:hypothetical protein
MDFTMIVIACCGVDLLLVHDDIGHMQVTGIVAMIRRRQD